jgi:hypothetical protein
MPKISIILALVSAVAFGVIYVGMVLPLSKPVPSFTATGTVVGRIFQEAGTLGKVGYGMKMGNQVQVGEHYLIDVRLDSGETLRGSWPAPTIENLPMGTRVKVQFQRRVLMLFWKRTWVDDIEPLASKQDSPSP